MHNPIDIEQSFRAAMADNGIITDAPIIPDGTLHRFHVNGDKAATVNGWYILFTNHIPCGKFGSWKLGISVAWCAKSRNEMTRYEWVKHCKQMDEAHHQRNIALIEIHQYTAVRAHTIWTIANKANPLQPYLQKKRIFSFIARQHGNTLILPICDISGNLWSLQFIYPNGNKILLKGGAKKGHFIPINGSLNASRILICEGFATGATLAQYNPSACVIAAVDAGNLEPVATIVRKHYPKAEIIICADDDRQTQGNRGLNEGRNAAIASGALFALPQWPTDAPETLTDFNDLACWLKLNKGVAI